MVSDPLDLYSRQALQFIYKFYDAEKGNLQKVQKLIRIEGKYISAKYRGEMFKYNIKNIMLIGLHRVYKIVLKSLEKPFYSWIVFNKKYACTLQNFDSYWKQVLLRIGIHDNPKMQ